MITLKNPELERRRRLLTILQLQAAQMDTKDLQRLLCIMQRARLLKKIHPKWGGLYLRFECWRRRLNRHHMER